LRSRSRPARWQIYSRARGRVLLVWPSDSGSQCVTLTRPSVTVAVTQYLQKRDSYTLSDTWKLHTIPGPPQPCMECATRRDFARSSTPAACCGPEFTVSSTRAAERRCRVWTRASRFCRLSPLMSTRTSILGDFYVECVRCWYHRLGRCQGIEPFTPAHTLLNDTDTDEIVGGEAHASTLSLRSLMHVAG